jgi:hypothetical protein
MISPPGREGCGTFYDVPLPCSRDLWEAMTNLEWTKQFQKQLFHRKLSRLLKVDDIRHMKSSSYEFTTDKISDDGLMADLMDWCSDLDSFGTLIWTAIGLDQIP